MYWLARLGIVCCLTVGSHVVNAQQQSRLQIVPGATWTATNTGQHVQAHGAGLIKVGNLYYMIGEDKSGGSSFQNVNCYSSPNLVEWTYVGPLLSRRAGGGDLGPGRVVERPKVIYNSRTKKFVLYMHIDSGNYKEAKVGVATGDSVCGRYRYHRSYQPMGRQSRDMGLFQDSDGSAYLLSEDRERGLHIYRLSPDYLNVTGSVHLWREKFEAPAILKRGRNYYMFSSHLSGWKPNDNIYSTATSLSGPWSSWKNFAPARSNTYNSQTTYILPVTESLAIYMGDRWVEKDLSRSTYVWLPLRISGTQVSLQNLESWDTPVGHSGAVGRSRDTTYPAKSARLGGGAKLVGNAAGYIGGPSAGTVKFASIQSGLDQRRTLKIFYSNRDRGTRYAAVTVNGGKAQRVAFLSTANGKGISAVTVQLKAGKNDISIAGLNGGWGPDVDSLKIAS